MLVSPKGIKYYSPKEIAEMFNISDRTVYAWIKTGKIKAVPYQIKRIMISEIELDKFISSHWGIIEN